MRKEVKIMVEETNFEFYCDDCGKKIDTEKNHNCDYCHKHLCSDCIAYIEEISGWYRRNFCKDCWEIAAPYLEKISELRKQIDVLESEWRIKCLGDAVQEK